MLETERAPVDIPENGEGNLPRNARAWTQRPLQNVSSPCDFHLFAKKNNNYPDFLFHF